MKSLLLTLLLLAQDAGLGRLVEELGDPDPAVRDRATGALAARGKDARAALKAASGDKDPEIRNRAADLLARLDQDDLLQALVKEQRPRKLKLPAEEKPGPPENGALTDGARFLFHRRPWAPQGIVLGTLFETTIETELLGTIEWSVAAVRESRDLPLETCDAHSPKLVYVPGPPPGNGVVVLKGMRRWYCSVPLEFAAPTDGMLRRVGPFTVTLHWPFIQVHSEAAIPEAVLRELLQESDVSIKLRPGLNRFGGRSTVTCRVGCGLRAEIKNPAWCGCDGKPYKAERPAVPMATDGIVRATHSSLELEDVASISLSFRYPVEEKFELTSPPLK